MQTTTGLNQTTKSPTSSKVDCAKECPCGVPVIPVPDQWLEVMVTGGFKVWHIIFIIIALIVTLVVVYCCFHRCRIPRTKQEIEADLMRSTMTNKFRDYLQELTSEQTTFLEALKKVQELEEKVEQDENLYSRDATARKRMGWLKLKGKGDKEEPAKPPEGAAQEEEKPVEAPKESVATTVLELDPKMTKRDSMQQVAAKLKVSTVSKVVTSAELPQIDNPNPEPVASENQKQDETKTTGNKQPARRRRQKPSLSRTKVTRQTKAHVEVEVEKPTELGVGSTTESHRSSRNRRVKSGLIKTSAHELENPDVG